MGKRKCWELGNPWRMGSVGNVGSWVWVWVWGQLRPQSLSQGEPWPGIATLSFGALPSQRDDAEVASLRDKTEHVPNPSSGEQQGDLVH